eukprot:m.215110 g.215110  ORF g.215110 m.215110 type:complete len:162 (+) comp39823_c1_seq1:1177-1662(+)
MTAFQKICESLRLECHVEGGYFRELYRGEPMGTEEKRDLSSHIYYALSNTDRSVIHKIDADEMWHFYAGDPVVIVELDSKQPGHATKTVLGPDILAGQTPFRVVSKGSWFGVHLLSRETWALCGCTMAPAFNPEGFAMGKRDDLIREYPEAEEIIIWQKSE